MCLKMKPCNDFVCHLAGKLVLQIYEALGLRWISVIVPPCLLTPIYHIAAGIVGAYQTPRSGNRQKWKRPENAAHTK